MQTEINPETPVNGWARLVVGKHPKKTLSRIAVTVITCAVVFGFLARPIRVVGVSMFPTFKQGQYNFINRVSYWFSEPRRFDVVAVDARKTEAHAVLLKRIIGLPGEEVKIEDGIVYINGEPLEETYVRARFPWKEGEHRLAANEYFVVGDNRAMIQSNHTHGVYDRVAIMGKVLWQK
ncbi:MAG: signal peptidase [Verrucomicrobia bacterium]|jgi:signal peptidase I|nr:signal peptidase [Verrucomicrobiota bacterium]